MAMHYKPIWSSEVIPRGSDPHIGAKLTQLTSAAMISHNIYCEERYMSADGARLAFLRSPTGAPPEQLWVSDLHTGEVARVSDSILGYPTSSLYSDNLYFIRATENSDRVLMCLNLRTMELHEAFDLSKCPRWRWSVPTISPDDRYFVGNFRVRDEIFGLYRVELTRGTWEVFHEHQDISNPHVQFEPSKGQELMIQLNHGGQHDADANVIRACDERGATLYVIDRDGKNERPLPVGKPHTPGVTGHQCWIGGTGRIAMTIFENQIHTVAPGDAKSRCIWKGLMYFGHMSVSSDGKYFLTDNFGGSNKLYIGSFATGRMIAVLDSHSTCGGPQYTHPHAYITPDNTHIIWTSERSGLPQVWSAQLPPELFAALDHPHLPM